MSELYIGLMSGTSMDGVDAVLVDLKSTPKLIAGQCANIPQDLINNLHSLKQASFNLEAYGELDVQMGKLFSSAALALIAQSQLSRNYIRAIGSHGQTVFHSPTGNHPFSLQIGNPNIIAQSTGITTIADFRNRDIAAGGEGAPLVPAFHHAVLHSLDEDRVVVNIGGIANITYLPADSLSKIVGFDTGPGNTLSDRWIQTHLERPYDKNGAWAANGKPIPDLLQHMLQDPFFKRTAPKSTGTEYFNLAWLRDHLSTIARPLNKEDVQATLIELTAITITDAINTCTQNIISIWVCGGGVYNMVLMQRLQKLMPKNRIASTAEAGINPDWMEAMAFAWLAQQTLTGKTGNLPSVTGAKSPVMLGGIYPGSNGWQVSSPK